MRLYDFETAANGFMTVKMHDESAEVFRRAPDHFGEDWMGFSTRYPLGFSREGGASLLPGWDDSESLRRLHSGCNGCARDRCNSEAAILLVELSVRDTKYMPVARRKPSPIGIITLGSTIAVE